MALSGNPVAVSATDFGKNVTLGSTNDVEDFNNMDQVTVDLILPAYNEVESLPLLLERIAEVFDPELNPSMRLAAVIIVDDGSTDGTRDLRPMDRRVEMVHLSRNFSKEAAILAGLDRSSADYAVVMDADGQHSPQDAAKLVRTAVQNGVEQVVGVRDRTLDPKFRAFASRLYYTIARRLLGVRLSDGSGDFRAISKKVVKAVCALRESDRFSKGIFEWVGFSSQQVTIQTAPRIGGKSKFTIRSLAALASSSLFAFNDGLLRRLMWLGLVSVAISTGLLVPVAWSILSGAEAPDGFLTLAGLQFLLAGTQVLLLSLVGEYISRTHRQGRHRPVYLIDEVSCGEAMSDQDGEA